MIKTDFGQVTPVRLHPASVPFNEAELIILGKLDEGTISFQAFGLFYGSMSDI